MQDSQQNTFTSAQRLTQLAVLVDCDAPMKELQKTVGGADEKERAILAKVLERTELLDSHGAPRPGAFLNMKSSQQPLAPSPPGRGNALMSGCWGLAIIR